MKKLLKILKYTVLSILTVMLLFYAFIIYATKVDNRILAAIQNHVERVSLPDTARSAFAEVAYSQPSRNNRKIFGGIVPFDKVWRTGANEATQITFKQDCI